MGVHIHLPEQGHVVVKTQRPHTALTVPKGVREGQVKVFRQHQPSPAPQRVRQDSRPPRGRCAWGTEDQATHRMSLAAAAASMSDWRRFESPPNERSTMSSFCASCDADACSWVDVASCWSVLQARSASARCEAAQRSRPQYGRRTSVSTSKNTHRRKTQLRRTRIIIY